MINFKPQLVKLLKTLNVTLYELYPNNFSTFPVVAYTEEENTPHTITNNGEIKTNLGYKIDIWHTASTSELKSKLDDLLVERGFTRTFCVDINESPELRHSVLRYEGVLDVKTNKIYKK